MTCNLVPPLAFLTPQSLEDPYGECVDEGDKENSRPARLPPADINLAASTRRAVQDVDNWVHRLPTGLATFTAELVTFLWFSSSLSLSSHQLSNPPSPLLPPTRIAHPLSPISLSSHGFPPSAQHHPLLPKPPPPLHLWPSPDFQRAVDSILQTTQVSSQVVLLATMYIDRFKKSSPATGERGSEVRLMVVALLLANKTLDDSAYTNKTWSEVSRIDLADLNRCERQFLQGIAFDLWTSADEFRAWLQRADDLHRSRQAAIAAWRQPAVATRLAKNAVPSPFPPLYPIPGLSSSQRPSSSGSASFYPSLDPLALPPLPLAHPASVAQRQSSQRVPQMSMAQLQVGSSSAYPSSSDLGALASQLQVRLPQPQPPPPHQHQHQHQQPSTQAYPPLAIPSIAPLMQLQPPQSTPFHATQASQQQIPFPSRHRPQLSTSSSSSLQLPRPHSSSHSVHTPRSNKRPAGEAFSSPPLPTLHDFAGSAPKRQARGSFDSSAVSTPSGPYAYPPQPHQQQVLPMSRETMGVLGMGAGGSAPGSSSGEMGLGAGFGTMGGGNGVLAARRGPSAPWPSMQDWTGGADALYAPVVFQQRDSNGDIKLYVQTLAASPLVGSPSYATYRKAVLQAAPPYAQPRYPSNLGQASSSYAYPDPFPCPQPSYAFPTTSQQPVQQQQQLQQQKHPGSYPPKDHLGHNFGPVPTAAAIRPSSLEALADGNGSPPELDWRTGRLERWRQGVVSDPVSEER